jgi:hypothetical protein
MNALAPVAMRDTRVRLAALLIGAAFVVLVTAIIGAIRVDAVNAAAPPAAVPDSALRFASLGTATNVAAANARDLFTDDRRAPAQRYLMPGEPEVTETAPPPLPTVLGTAIGSDGRHFAIVQSGGGGPTIIRANAQVGGYTVLSIERGKVAFRGADGVRFTVDASKP